jgi:hypothetical protein
MYRIAAPPPLVPTIDIKKKSRGTMSLLNARCIGGCTPPHTCTNHIEISTPDELPPLELVPTIEINTAIWRRN